MYTYDIVLMYTNVAPIICDNDNQSLNYLHRVKNAILLVTIKRYHS